MTPDRLRYRFLGQNRLTQASCEIRRGCRHKQGQSLRKVVLTRRMCFRKSSGNGDERCNGIGRAAWRGRSQQSAKRAAQKSAYRRDQPGEDDESEWRAVPRAVMVRDLEEPCKIQSQGDKGSQQGGEGGASNAHTGVR